MSKRLLIAPLDWGLGHATRCIPIIRYLLECGHQPVIAASGRPLTLLQEEFPTVECVPFQGYDISYPTGSGMVWKMFRSTPHILRRIEEEHHELQALIREHDIDGVVSDNRFGLHTDLVPCAYLTHQVMIKAPAPFLERMLYRLHLKYMRKFTKVWVPDFERNGLSGDLAHQFPLPINGSYIGPLSRFSAQRGKKEYDVLVVISGPEPQRTRFEQLVLAQLEEFEGTAMAVLGTPGDHVDRTDDHGHRIVSHLDAKHLQQAMAATDIVVSRSGYSTIMDLSVMGKKAVFVPTPGQTEQEYLARMFSNAGMHHMVSQRKFRLLKALKASNDHSGFEMRSSEGFRTAMDEFLQLI